jgi:pimeloyl-ACP methyl ester carboxylesterase
VDIVLVHGLFHGAWCWDQVRARLDPGFRVIAPDLPLTSVQDDAAVVQDILRTSARRMRRILLVGHSYGGVVISEAGVADDGSSADYLIYLAAVVPDPGQTLIQSVRGSGKPMEARDRAIRFAGDGTVALSGPDRDVVAALYNRTSAETFEQIKSLFRPASASLYTTPVERPAWTRLPSTYVVCEDDFVLDSDYQRASAEKLTDSVTILADHSAFYSAADAVTAIIRRYAQRLEGAA